MLLLQKLQTIGEDFCGLDVNTPLGGNEAVTERPVITMNNALLTSVAATSTGDFTVVFLGTSKGHLKKVICLTIFLAFYIRESRPSAGELCNFESRKLIDELKRCPRGLIGEFA